MLIKPRLKNTYSETIELYPILRERLRTVDVLVNGNKGRFHFDTTGGVTMISPDFSKKVGCIEKAV